MSYNSSSMTNIYSNLNSSKPIKALDNKLKERKGSILFSNNSKQGQQRSADGSTAFLRSTMGVLLNRPNNEFFKSVGFQSERKQQINFRHRAGNLSSNFKNIRLETNFQQQQPLISRKYAEVTFPQSTASQPVRNFKKQQKSQFSSTESTEKIRNQDCNHNKEKRKEKITIEDILNKLKREKDLEKELKKLRQEKKIREQKQQRINKTKTTPSLFNVPQNSSSSPFSNSAKLKQLPGNPDGFFTSNVYLKTDVYQVNDSPPETSQKYDFKKGKNYSSYTPKGENNFLKNYEDFIKKYDTTEKKQQNQKIPKNEPSLKFSKYIEKNFIDSDKSNQESFLKYNQKLKNDVIDFDKSCTTKTTRNLDSSSNKFAKSAVSIMKLEDSFSQYFSSVLKGQKFDCKVGVKDFKLGKQLGEGKFGTVYQAIHRATHSLYALKKVPKSTIKNHFMIDQFTLELKLQTFMNNQQVLALYGFFHDHEHIYLILDYMEEGTLYSALKINKKLQYDDAARKIKEITKGIIYMHEYGIAHRDIKPENVVMSHGSCKLCDFGWSTICNERRKTYCGTFDYVAPQILQGIEYDMSVDLWCLGVLAYELLVGKAPFYHIKKQETKKKILNVESQPINYPQNLPKDAVDFIQKLLKKDPEQRIKDKQLLHHPFLAKVP